MVSVVGSCEGGGAMGHELHPAAVGSGDNRAAIRCLPHRHPRSRRRSKTADRQDAALFLRHRNLARTPAYSRRHLDGNQ